MASARDPYRYFRIEARELLDQLGKAALELEKGEGSTALIALMLRLAHTLKGAARVVKQRQIADRAHAIEETLEPFRAGEAAPPRAALDAIQQELDAIGSLLPGLGTAEEPRGTANGGGGAVNGPRGAARAQSADPVPRDGAPAAFEIDPATRNTDEIGHMLDGISEAGVQLGAARVALAKLQRGGAHRSAEQALEQLDRELGQVRDAAERLRLLPASLLFVPLERAARDAARSLGKSVEFAAQGGEVRLDAQIFELMQGALLQVVRNGVAHGIEPPAERNSLGKPEAGRLSIEVARRGHRIAFVCRDDGRGVDLEAARRGLAEKGLLPANAADLDGDALLELLLGAGISTSANVTQIAGRGIGLDVVREAARRLRGEVRWHTEPGQGTRFTIEVPVSLAAIDALLVESGGRIVGIPLESVRRTLRVQADELAASPQGLALSFEDKVIPFAPLERALSRGKRAGAQVRAWSAVIVEGAGGLGAVGVERLRGTQNLILHPLPEHARCDAIVAGASLNARGDPQLILDPGALVAFAHRAQPSEPAAQGARLPILVVDDSLTTRMLEQSILESAGYQVVLAVSGEDGLERLREHRVACILVDVEMPGMDGFSFVRRIRADPAHSAIPAILVSSRASPEDRRRGQEAGAHGYIAKGEFDQNALLAKIRSLIEAP